MTNVSRLANAGSSYEQLISQVIAIESQPRLRLRAQQTDQTVYKGVLSDFSSRVSALDGVLDKLRDGLRSPFAARAATVTGAALTATASDDAAPGTYAVRVGRLAQADARLSRRVEGAGTDVADLFVDPGDPGDPGSPGGIFGGGRPPRPATPDRMGERSFTIRVAQPEGEAVALDVRYTPPEGASNDDVLRGIAGAVQSAAADAQADGRLAEGTGVTASVVRETSGTARLSLGSAATGWTNRLQFDDPDGVLAALEVNRETARQGPGGGAVRAVGTGVEGSELSAAFDLDGLTLYRDSNTVSDALDGVTLTLASASDEPARLTVGADTQAMRGEVEAFVKAYNDLNGFITSKTAVNADTGARGALASDSGVRGLRQNLRADLSTAVDGLRLADLGITAARDGTLSLSDPAALDGALARSPQAVAALFTGAGGVGERISGRLEGLTGAAGSIAQRKKSADARIQSLGGQIARWETRLATRETQLREQFAQLQAITTRAQSQQNSLATLFFF